MTVTMDLARKTGTTLLAYSGTNATAPIEAFAAAAEDIDRAEHTTPPVVTSAERWTVSFWADKTVDNSAWTPPAGQIARHESHGTGVGRISMLATDSGQRDPAGTNGLLTATSSSADNTATMWTLVLAPADR